MIEPFEEWCYNPPSELTRDQKLYLLQNKRQLVDYLRGCRNDITRLPLLEFIKALERGEPYIFSIPDLPENTLKWLAMTDMENESYLRNLEVEAIKESPQTIKSGLYQFD